MERFILFLHVLGAVAMGFYLLAPLIVAQLNKLEGEAKSGVLSVMRSLNRYAQYGLVLELLTGIYLIVQDEYSLLWTILTFALFLLIGGFGGMMGGPLRRALDGLRDRRDIASELRKLRLFGSMVCASFLGILFVMMFHRLFA